MQGQATDSMRDSLVHDQPELIRTRLVVVNLVRPLKFKTSRRLEFLMSGTSDVTPAMSSSPKTFWRFSAVCLTDFLFEFLPETFAIELNEKSLQDQRF